MSKDMLATQPLPVAVNPSLHWNLQPTIGSQISTAPTGGGGQGTQLEPQLWMDRSSAQVAPQR